MIAPDFKYNEGVKFIDLYNAKIASTLILCFKSNLTSLILSIMLSNIVPLAQPSFDFLSLKCH